MLASRITYFAKSTLRSALNRSSRLPAGSYIVLKPGIPIRNIPSLHGVTNWELKLWDSRNEERRRAAYKSCGIDCLMYNKTAGKIAKIVEKMLMRTLQGITRRSQTEWYHISVTDGGVALKRVIVLFSSYNFRSEEDIGTFLSLARRILEPVIVIPTEELLRVRAPVETTLADFEDSYGPTLESVPFPDCLLPAPPQHNERITIGPIFTNADCLDIIKAMNRVSSTGQTRMHFDTIPHGVFTLSILLRFEESGRAQEWLGGWREKASEVLKEKVVAEFSDN